MSSRPMTRSRLPDGHRLVSAQDRFATRASGSRWRRLRRMLLVLLVAALATAVGWLVYLSPVLTVQRVTVSGVPDGDVAAIRQLAAVPPNTPLARVDTGAVADRIAGRPSVAHVSVARSYPQTLTVRITLRQPVLAIQQAGGSLGLVDVEGVDYETVGRAPSDVPVIRTTTGSVSQEGVAAALSMLSVLEPDLVDHVHDLEVSDVDVLSFSIGSTSVVWGTSERPEVKAEIVRALLHRSPDVIDVSAPDTPVTR